MTKIARNKQSLSANILQLMYKLNDHGLLTSFQHDMGRYERNEGNKAMFKLFNKLIKANTPIEEIPSDAYMANELKVVTNFNDKKQDFYLRLVTFIGREMDKKDDVYKRILVMLKEVDGLWNLGLLNHAEVRLLDIYKIYPKEMTYDTKSGFRYGEFKMFSYALHFKQMKNTLGKTKNHEDFLNRSEFQLIRDIEYAASCLNLNNGKRPMVTDWESATAEFRFLEVLGTIAKQRKQFKEAREYLQKMQSIHFNLLKHTYLNIISNGNRFPNNNDNQPKPSQEIQFAFQYYLKMEEFHLLIANGNSDEAKRVLEDVHSMIRNLTENSNHYLVGLLLYLKLELQQSHYALALSERTMGTVEDEFENNFLATQQDLKNLPVRLEANQLIFQFLSSTQRPNPENFANAIKELSGKLKEKDNIKLDISLLKLFINIESYRSNEKADIIR